MLNQRYQSLLEPGFRQTGWDSPTSRSQRANQPEVPRETGGTQGDWSCVRPKGPRLQPCACRLKPPRGTRTSSHTSPLRGRVGMAAVRSPYVGPDQSVGPGGLATPGSGGCLRALPRQSDALLAFRADGAVVWSTDGAPTPCVVFLIGFASLINSLTSGKNIFEN